MLLFWICRLCGLGVLSPAKPYCSLPMEDPMKTCVGFREPRRRERSQQRAMDEVPAVQQLCLSWVAALPTTPEPQALNPKAQNQPKPECLNCSLHEAWKPDSQIVLQGLVCDRKGVGGRLHSSASLCVVFARELGILSLSICEKIQTR